MAMTLLPLQMANISIAIIIVPDNARIHHSEGALPRSCVQSLPVSFSRWDSNPCASNTTGTGSIQPSTSTGGCNDSTDDRDESNQHTQDSSDHGTMIGSTGTARDREGTYSCRWESVPSKNRRRSMSSPCRPGHKRDNNKSMAI
ncbi:expressed unknown protein [Seminavis robusta]|uniref:Uncharacterized protein n=1 Tax=Seminavis robusta TaxID=568900 RepID=A0A9N8DP66_9STRA|nr:expressed unknown protein [Seminavis robusta]|eukprot:Sro192_g082541.1  (144) ;mRNA; f:80096-80527